MISRILLPAVFLDRDGVLVKEKGYITTFEQMEIYPYAANCITKLNENGWLCFMVTNQSAVARGMLTEKKLQEIHDCLCKHLNEQQAFLDAAYYCPHLPLLEGEDNILPYRRYCSCRKPNIGMIERAQSQYRIDMSRSFIIGDRESDIMLGYNAGLTTILVRTGYGLTDYKEKTIQPDYIFDSLVEAVEFIINADRNQKDLAGG